MTRRLAVVQLLPQLDVGGVERGTIQIAQALQQAGHRAIVIAAPGRLLPELLACGAEHVALAIGDKRLASLAHIGALRRYFTDQDIDIVHARSRLPAWLGHLALGRRRAGTRPAWITTVHGPYTVNRYSRIMMSGDLVIAISEFIRDYILKSYRGVPRERIVVIPRGVDRATFVYAHTPSADWRAAWVHAHPALAGKALLTLAARVTRWKGQLDFLDVMAALRRRGIGVHGLVAGAAHPRKQAFAQELQYRVRQLGLEHDVSFLGQRDDLREILAVSAVALSLTKEPEAFGRTTIEALSLGTPVVGYDHGGTAEILRAVYPYGLVTRGDIEAVVNRVAALIEERPAVPRDHPYTVERMQQATLALYQEVAGGVRAEVHQAR